MTFDDIEKQKIYNLLKKTPQTINQISRNLKQGIEEVSAILSLLELEGIIEKEVGDMYKIKCI